MSERDYLKGVPLRLGKSFYPVARPQFKEIDIHIPLDALQDEYDFGLEKVVIETYDSYHKEKAQFLLKEEVRRKEEEKAAAIEKERLDRLRLEADQHRKEQEEKQRLDELAASEAAAQERERKRAESQPLQPQPQPQYCRTNAVGVDRSGVNSTLMKVPSSNWAKNVNLNLSDFESDTGNPFDSAEMNSINDKAELASIWANNTDFSGANIISTVPNTSASMPLAPHSAAVTTSTSTLPQPPTAAASAVNSFTKIHFPFLTNYTQTSRERAAERSYHQQFNSVPRPLQQHFPLSPSTTALPNSGIGNNQVIPGPTINTTPSQNRGFLPPGNWPVPAAHHFPTNK